MAWEVLITGAIGILPDILNTVYIVVATLLIVLPLGVKQEFSRDAVALLHYEAPPYVRTQAEADAYDGEIVMTNYERVRDGDIDPKKFCAVALDLSLIHI